MSAVARVLEVADLTKRSTPTTGSDALYVLGAARLFSWSLRQVRPRGLLSRFGE
jgi:hypothetical protein